MNLVRLFDCYTVFFLFFFSLFSLHIFNVLCSVNFKKNEKQFNAEQSAVLRALQESGNEPEPGNDELLSHYYALAFMLKVLNDDGERDGNIFTQDKLIE